MYMTSACHLNFRTGPRLTVDGYLLPTPRQLVDPPFPSRLKLVSSVSLLRIPDHASLHSPLQPLPPTSTHLYPEEMTSRATIEGNDTIADTVSFVGDSGSEPTPNTNAWGRISSTIRQVDADRVKDCQDYIDNILVFAGLYSAVLTALLVESYKTLKQDPQDVMVFLLQQLVVQTNSFVINDRFVNSTVLNPTLVPAFTPSLSAQRVNTSWFTSLTLSLISASFSIIVKQWLREFLAMEQSSPRAHLRIRYFRNPGLEYYKVFEIAMFLPLLLQLSLLLFFIGLCFFTASVHKNIGDTTTTLVVAWGFLVIATTLLPIGDPTCPYKVPILQRPIKAFRKLLFHSEGHEVHAKSARTGVRSANDEHSDGASQPDISGPQPVQAALRGTDTDHAEETTALCEGVVRFDAQDGEASVQVREKIEQVSPSYTPSGNEQNSSSGTRARFGRAAMDEDYIARGDHMDVDILVDALKIDAVQADDQLLKDITFEALQQASIRPHELWKFPFEVINRRVELVKADEFQKELPSLKNLSHQTYATITHMLALLVEGAESQLDKLLCSSSGDNGLKWLEDSICILLSEADFQHSPTVNEALYACLRKNRYKHLVELITRRFGLMLPKFGRIFSRLQGGLAMEKDTQRLLDMIEHIFECLPHGQSNTGSQRKRVSCPPDCQLPLQKLLTQRIKIDGSEDIATLTRVDALLLNDKVLLGTIWNTLQHSRNSEGPTHLSSFIIGAITNRIGRSVSVQVRKEFLSLDMLAPTSYNTIMTLSAQFVIEEVRRQSKHPQLPGACTGYADELGDVVCVLLSRWSGRDPDCSSLVNEALRACISDGRHIQTADLIKSRSRISHPPLSTLRNALKRLEGAFALPLAATYSSIHLIEFIQHLFPVLPVMDDSPKNQLQSRTRQQELPTLRIGNEGAVLYDIPDSCKEVTVDFLISKIRRGEWDQHEPLLLEGIFTLTQNATWKMKVVSLVKRILTGIGGTELAGQSGQVTDKGFSESAMAICDMALATITHSRTTRDKARTIFFEAAANVEGPEELTGILLTLHKYSTRQPSGTSLGSLRGEVAQSPEALSLHSCEFYLELMKNFKSKHLYDAHHSEQWKRLFEPILDSLKKLSADFVYSHLDPYTRQMASRCLDLISDVSSSTAKERYPIPQFLAGRLKTTLESIRDMGQMGPAPN